ncbi:DeoR/GlpR family DNA-binding transcription regulator [Trinickia caryophylli]|uniref:Transcriptional regulator, DeoR family n=1 Tax=Trinickia caryophylli TaxID=28094 RepID=A0A1X7EUB4_TRICW|nr:DeoR/GlpR family DNA-binding transcription regulator [Trinickia caryophylli]PMS12169.1 DeoR/GlpR transcriptional regulator [Trinickia caryophylli]TRX18523.1 DeoR/GlpR transcriptional regulator [Trinickia caryophylli]WQE10687.1 DeoR/GlpR family DNA-binding transcription regulator [Trinickia caryophylli]SMF40285.1 transcriptional regulator, DeoR family [Trinickia caryophylli]GLU33057.1 DeoR family transcriptional regulator [Trinickia caryophylli]
MLKPERLHALAEALAKHNVLHLRDAAALLGVSEMTVRRDIAAHPDRFTYLGGYIVSAVQVPNAAGYSLEQEKDHFATAKAQASAHAARLIADNETIFIDCGTTLASLARLIPATMQLTVVCYSLNVAEILRRMPNVRMILLGGVYVPSSDSFTGDESLDMLRRMGINKAFISAGGIDPARGVTCWNFHEVALKQAAMANAVERHLVADSSKFGVVKAVRFSQIDEFDSIITEKGIERRGRNG